MPNSRTATDERTASAQRRQSLSRRQLLSGLAVGGAGLTICATGAYALGHSDDAESAPEAEAPAEDVPLAVHEAVSDTADETEPAGTADRFHTGAAADDPGSAPVTDDSADAADDSGDEADGHRTGHARHQ